MCCEMGSALAKCTPVEAEQVLWRQMMADVYGCSVRTVKSKEGPALSAILAAVGTGLYPDVKTACDAMIEANSNRNRRKYSKVRQLP